jgi:hypothetical protein
MATWLNKASGLFQRSTAGGGSEREPYQFVCECGKRVTGLRESRFQQFPCEACGRVVFVLPENVYPRPAPARKPDQRASSDERAAEPAQKPAAETDPNDFAESQLPPTRRKKSDLDVNGGVRPQRKDTSRPPEPATQTRLELPRRRRWTPVRIVLAGIILLVLTTSLGLGWRWRIDRARITLPAALEKGLAAFADRDFVDATRELGYAKSAAEILGKRDAEAITIRQRWREARAARDLAPFMLIDWLQECISRPADEKQKAASSAIDRINGTWLIMDVSVVYVGENREPMADVLLMAGETPVEVDLPLPKVILRLAADERPTRVIVGAQVAQFQSPGDGNSAWQLKFVPDSVFLWTDYDTYRAVGFETAEDESPVLQELFASQRRWEEARE